MTIEVSRVKKLNDSVLHLLQMFHRPRNLLMHSKEMESIWWSMFYQLTEDKPDCD